MSTGGFSAAARLSNEPEAEDAMKQIAQNYKSGELTVLDVPAPACRPGGVLVRSLFSLISTGTEMMKLTEAKMSMVGKARARPDQVRKVLDSVAQQGAVTTYKKVMNRLDSYTPLGYSLCGVVTEVGRGAEEFRVGQLVAAAGNEYALHAEYNWVPVNLCVPVPEGVSPEHAAFATVGAIAMHGVRRAEVQLGDTACVIGLGLVGQLVVRLLIAAGVRVVGLDTIEDRCRLAEKAGAIAVRSSDRRRGGGRPAGARRDSPTDAGLTMCSWPRADHPTGRWRSRPGWHATAPAWWTSARPGWICRGTLTTTRNSTSASRAPTDLAGTTTVTSLRASITRRATCAGPSGGTLSASSTSSPARTSRSSRSSRASSRWISAATVYSDLASGSLAAVGVLLEYPAEPRDSQPPDGEPADLGGPRRPRAVRLSSSWPPGSSAQATTPHRCCCRTSPGSRPSGWPTLRQPGRCPRSTRSGASASRPPRPPRMPCSTISRWTRSSS